MVFLCFSFFKRERDYYRVYLEGGGSLVSWLDSVWRRGWYGERYVSVCIVVVVVVGIIMF